MLIWFAGCLLNVSNSTANRGQAESFSASDSSMVLRLQWCAQTVPKCGSFQSVVEGAMLPALEKVRACSSISTASSDANLWWCQH